MHVLIVDDDQFILDLLASILTAENKNTVECTISPIDALRKLSKSPQNFDCLIYDIVMPEMNGIELCRRTRSISELDDIPILILTAKHETRYLVEATRAGATDYITKPFDVLEIGFRINSALELQAAKKILNQSSAEPESEKIKLSGRKMTTKNEIMTIFAEDLYKVNKR